MSLEAKAAEAKEKLAARHVGTEQATLKQPNPADNLAPAARMAERKRIPMTLPTQKLECPEIPGYFTYWMRGTPDRLQQADRAGFEFVTQDEIMVNNNSLGGDASRDGSTDMGTRVSVIASSSGSGETDGGNQPLRLYLMKQKWEWHLEDQAILDRKNDGVANALSASFDAGLVGGKVPGETQEDMSQRYVDAKRSRRPDLFKPKRERVRPR